MDFNQISDQLLLKIFRRLPLQDVIRLGRLNSRCYQISALAISKTKVINLRDKQLSVLKENVFGSLLVKCQGKLRKIIFAEKSGSYIDIFEGLSFPELVEIDLGLNTIFAGQFGNLIKRNHNLATVKSNCGKNEEPSRIIFPADMVFEKLETVKVSVADEDFFRSMIDHCPNLKKLTIGEISSKDSIVRFKAIMNKFFASCSKLESFRLRFAGDSVDDRGLRQNRLLMDVESFWLLPMRDLRLNLEWCPRQGLLQKIISSFRHLEVLRVANYPYVTPQAISDLASLKNLRWLELTGQSIADVDQSLKKFIGNQMIERLFVEGVSLSTAMELGRHCPELKAVEKKSRERSYVRVVETITPCRNCSHCRRQRCIYSRIEC